MSTDGETSNRLSAALDQIFSRSSELEAAPDVADEPYELPEIVPATEDVPAAVQPTLPARQEPTERTPETAPPTEPVPTPPPTQPAAPVATPAAGAAASPGATGGAPTTSWSDHLAAVPATARNSGLRTPGRKPRVRRVTRVLRHIDPWSTFKVGLLFSLVTYLVALTSGVLLWRVADSTGTLDNVERWFTQFGWETFELDGGEVFHNAWIIGLFGVVGMTGALVLLATVFNLVSDIIGGVRMTVLEEEVVERTITSTRRYVVRQGPAAAGVPAAAPPQDWDVDDDSAGDADARPLTPTRRDDAPAATPSTTPVPAQDWSID